MEKNKRRLDNIPVVNEDFKYTAVDVCPKCGSRDNSVYMSRMVLDNEGLYRRRRCNNCNARWTTYEVKEEDLQRLVEMARSEKNENEKCSETFSWRRVGL